MSGRHPFSELTKDFPPERRRRIDAMKPKLLADMPMYELRRARALSQQDLAEKLKVDQPDIARLERTGRYVCLEPPFLHRGGGWEAEDHRRVFLKAMWLSPTSPKWER